MVHIVHFLPFSIIFLHFPAHYTHTSKHRKYSVACMQWAGCLPCHVAYIKIHRNKNNRNKEHIMNIRSVCKYNNRLAAFVRLFRSLLH